MPQYELYIPLEYNDGRSVERDKLHRTKEELVREFGGLTVFPPAGGAEGYWLHEGELVEDNILIFRIVVSYNADKWISDYKETLKLRFEQDEVFVVKSPGQAL